jgi:hypothetical protein
MAKEKNRDVAEPRGPLSPASLCSVEKAFQDLVSNPFSGRTLLA